MKFLFKRNGGQGVLLWPGAIMFVPLALLFINSMNGLTVADAFSNSLRMFFTWGPGLIVWVQVVVLNLFLFLYVAPLVHVQKCSWEGRAISPALVDKAMDTLNWLPRKVLGISIFTFLAGGAIRALLEGRIPGLGHGMGMAESFYVGLGESAVTGMFVGVILALHFDNGMFRIRETVLSLNPSRPLRYSSLYGKIFLILSSIVIFAVFMTFESMGSFYSLGVRNPGLLPDPRELLLTGPQLLFQSSKFQGLREVADVFALRVGLFSLFVIQLLWQVKQQFKHPLDTVIKHLKILNNPQADCCTEAIRILQNDEYAPVYREINTLISKQQGRLEISERRLEGIIANAPDPIVAFDGNRHIRVYNPAAEAAFGYPAADVLGKDLNLLLPSPDQDIIQAHKDGYAQFEWTCNHGQKVLMESHLSETTQGSDDWTTVILRDITAQAELEATLTRARQEAETASRMKSEFLANMSHELRTPLNAILGFTQLMGEDKNLTDAQRDRIKVISRSGEHLLALINDILDISKIEAGKMDLHPVVFDLPQLIADLTDMFALKARSKGLTLYTDTLEGLPRYVEGDLGKLRQVMINLLGNAVKFTAEGGVSILVGKEGDRIRFSVQDTGRGIPEKEQKLILQPFVQATTTDHEGGTGLGLAISSRYVEMMGGRLELESVLGEGSTFSFVLPLEESSRRPESEEGDHSAIAVKPGHEVTALIVDDQLTNRLVLKEMLERIGFQILEAENGRQAVERAKEFHPALIFMDIKMPVMDGYGAVKILKESEETRHLRVFALTASAFSHDEVKIQEAGFDGFLAKPFKTSRLYRLIREKGQVDLVYEQAAGNQDAASSPRDLTQEDFKLALWALGQEGLVRFQDSASIGDYGNLKTMADILEQTAPAFAKALRSSAQAFDEGAITLLLEGLHG